LLLNRRSRNSGIADDDQGERRHPFIGSNAEPDHVARSGHSNNLLGGDVRGDQ
jgi:hypothetical protein